MKVTHLELILTQSHRKNSPFYLKLIYLTKWFKIMHSNLSPQKITIVKNALSEVSVWVYWAYNRICMLVIKAHNNRGCTGIVPVLLPSAEGLKQSALTTRSRSHFSNWKNGKYIDRRFNGITTGQIILNGL